MNDKRHRAHAPPNEVETPQHIEALMGDPQIAQELRELEVDPPAVDFLEPIKLGVRIPIRRDPNTSKNSKDESSQD